MFLVTSTSLFPSHAKTGLTRLVALILLLFQRFACYFFVMRFNMLCVSFLVRFWTPKWSQNRPQIHPKPITHTIIVSTSICNRFLITFFTIYQTREPLKSSKTLGFLYVSIYSAIRNITLIRIQLFI